MATYVASYGPASPTSDSVATTTASASITCALGDLLVITVGTGNETVRPQSVSGGGLTWTKLVEANSAYSSFTSCNSVFYAAATSAQTFTATVTVTDTASAGHGWNWQCQRWSSARIGAFASAPASTGTLSLTTTEANCAIVLALSDYNAVAGARTYSTATAGSFTQTYANISASEALHSGYYANAGAVGAKTVGITAPTGVQQAAVAVELVGNTGTATLSGTGTLAAITTKPGLTGSVALSGTGTLSGSGVANVGYSGSVAFSGAGTLATAGNPGVTGALALAGSGSLSLSAPVPVAGNLVFHTPIVQRRMPISPPLTALINFSVAVLRIGGQWVETEYPSEDEINAADLYFPGGYLNVVDQATANILTAAGYTVVTEST